MTKVVKRPRPDVEEHPSFAVARANRISSSPPGVSLFDSEIRHSHFVRLTIERANRRRDLMQDWIHATDRLIEIDMSMAQWGALVSSFGDGSGVPVTLAFLTGEGSIAEPAYEPRMKQSVEEVEGASDKVFGEVADAAAALRKAFDGKAGRKEMEQALWDLEIRLKNAKPNLKFAADSLTEHVENVVTKARYDIEATVRLAAERGLDAADAVAGMLGAGEEQS